MRSPGAVARGEFVQPAWARNLISRVEREPADGGNVISKLVIVGLVLVWAAVLLPDLLARVSRGRRSDTIRSFNTQLSSLGRSAPVQHDNVIDLRSRRPAPAMATNRLATGGSAPRPVSAATRKRRQDVLVALGAAALLTLLATVAFGGIFLYVHLACDLAMAAYLIALQRVGAAKPLPSASFGPTPVSSIGSGAVQARTVQPRRIAN